MPAHPKYHHFLQQLQPDELYAAITIVSLAEATGDLDQWAVQQRIDGSTARKRLQGALNTFRTRNIADAPDGKLQVYNREIAAWYGARWRLAAECDALETREALHASLATQTNAPVTAVEPTSKKPTRKATPHAVNGGRKRIKYSFLTLIFFLISTSTAFLSSHVSFDNVSNNRSTSFSDKDQFDLAWNEFLSGNQVEASKILYKILKNSPKGHIYASCHYLLGAIKINERRYNSSIQNLQKAEDEYRSIGNLEDLIKTQILKSKSYNGLKSNEDLISLSLSIESNLSILESQKDKNKAVYFSIKGMWRWTQSEIALANGNMTDFKWFSEIAHQNFVESGHAEAIFKSSALISFYRIYFEGCTPDTISDDLIAIYNFNKNSNNISPEYRELATHLNSLVGDIPSSLEQLKKTSALYSNEVLNYLLKKQNRREF